MRSAGIALLLALVGITSAWARPDTVPTVTCYQVVTPGEPVVWRPMRVVLGVVAVPPAYIPQTTESGDPRWPWWSKSGLVVRAGSPNVVVSVPRRWRHRVAIGWGTASAVGALRIASCPSGVMDGWNPYAGGFVLKRRSACVPLTFRAGDRTATVRFGVGKRCA